MEVSLWHADRDGQHLKLKDAATLLQAMLAEEKGADEKLTKIAEQGGNQGATLEK